MQQEVQPVAVTRRRLVNVFRFLMKRKAIKLTWVYDPEDPKHWLQGNLRSCTVSDHNGGHYRLTVNVDAHTVTLPIPEGAEFTGRGQITWPGGYVTLDVLEM